MEIKQLTKKGRIDVRGFHARSSYSICRLQKKQDNSYKIKQSFASDFEREEETNILLQDMIWLARSSHRFIGFDRADKEMAAFKDRIFLKE